MRGLLERVEALLGSDGDPQVVANCLYVMQQVRGAASLPPGQHDSLLAARWRPAAGARLCTERCADASWPRPSCHLGHPPWLPIHPPCRQVGMLEGRLTRQLVISLLNHIRAFSDWAQCLVLDLVAAYRPASEEERFDILEVG